MFIGWFTINKDHKNQLNISYSFFAFSLALWSFAHFMIFTSSNSESALFWDNFANFGSILTPISLFIFTLVLTKIYNKMHKIIFTFLILLGLVLIYLSLLPNMMAVSSTPSWWGYDVMDGTLWPTVVILNLLLTTLSILLCLIRVNKKEKASIIKQKRLIGLGILFPFIGGVCTQIIPRILDFSMMPLTTFFSTVTAVVIAYEILKHELMIPYNASYKKKITTIIISLIMFISILTLLPGYVIAKSETELDIIYQLDADSKARANHIEHFLNEQKEDFNQLSEILKQENIIQLHNNTIDFESSSLALKILNNVKSSQEDISNIELLDANGKIIFSTNQSCIGLTRNEQDITTAYYNQNFNDVHICPITNQPIMSLTGPLNIKNNTIGYLVFFIDLNELYSILLQPSSLGKTVEYYLVDSNGFMISPSQFVDNVVLTIRINSKNYERAMLHLSDNVDELLHYDEVFIYENYRGIEVIGTHIDIPQMNWLLLAEQDVSEAYVPIYSLQTILFLVFIGILIIGFFISAIISKILTKPIQELIVASNKISQGDYDYKVNISTNDEIGILNKSFNLMAKNIKTSNKKIEEYNKNLELLVNKRTNELQTKINELFIAKKEISLKNIELSKSKNELEKLNWNLELKVTERTKEINTILKLKDDFVNQLGHDLKNPLGPILNLLPVLEKYETDEKRKEYINVMKRNASYMKNLVTKTIELARLNSPNTIFQFEKIDLQKVLTDVLEQNGNLFESKNMKIKNNIIDHYFVNADKLRIMELLNNLLNNAVKYSNEKGNIHLDAESDGDTVIVSICDTGIGIDADQINHVFDEFYKADESRHDFDSSGLGMTICKRIVDKHGGKIWVESEGIGKGSTFYFSLPMMS